MKKSRRFPGLMLALVMLAGLLSAHVLAAPVDYGLTIAGVRVTSDNWYDPLHNGVFQYMYTTKILVIQGDYAAGSGVDTLIESDVDGLTINVCTNAALTMQKAGATFLKLNGDTTILTTTERTAGSLVLVNDAVGGTGILVNNCSLTLDYFELDARDLTYGIQGQGSGSDLALNNSSLRITSTKAAVCGFQGSLTMTGGELLMPESATIDNAIRDSDEKLAPIVELRTTGWDTVFQHFDNEQIEELSTNQDYDIDLVQLFAHAAHPSNTWLSTKSWNLVKGSLPVGMSLEIAPGDEYPETHKVLRLRGRPALPGSYELWLILTGIDQKTGNLTTGFKKLTLNVYYVSDTDYYDLWIDGTRVDSGHLEMGSGAFSYDPDLKTLTIQKSYSQDWPVELIRSGIDGLTVEIPQDVTLTAGSTAFRLEKNTRFRGEGRLTVKSAGGDGIRVAGGAALTLLNADLDVEAAGAAVAGSDGGERLWLETSHLSARGGGSAVTGFSGGIVLSPSAGMQIKTPAGGTVSGGSIVDSGGHTAAKAEVIVVRTFGVKIAGTTVTEENRKDILGDGAFSFDGDRTLTVKKSFTTGPSDYYTHIIENDSVDGLVIRVANDAVLSIDPNCMGIPILTKRETTITGPGRLTLTCGSMAFNPLLNASGDLTLRDLTLSVTGNNWAIQGNRMYPNKLIIENSSVLSSTAYGNPAVCDFLNGIELHGCRIALPEGGEIKDGAIVASGGSGASQVTVRPLEPVTGVTLDRTDLTLTVGSSRTLTASLSPENASNRSVAWESSAPSVAFVDDSGTVTGVSSGKATVTVKTADGAKTASCEVTVADPIRVSGVTLNASEMTIAVNSVVFLTAAVSPVNATEKAVTWQSDAPAVATVDAGGMVKGMSPGEAVITVKTKDGAKTAQCRFTVEAGNPVESVALDKTELTLPFGGSGKLKATVSPQDATNQAVIWQSDDPSVAAVSPSGRVTAVAAGTAMITVRTADGAKTASCSVTVLPPVAVTGVTLDKKELTLVAGQSPFDVATLTATVSPADAANKDVTWKSSDPSIALVYDGIVTARAKGTVEITVKTADGEKTDSCTVTVIDPVYIKKVSLDPTMSLNVSESRQLTPVFEPSNATNKLVIWNSSDETVAKVDSYGVVTGRSAGIAAISGQTVDGGKMVVCAVTVTDPSAVIQPWSFDKATGNITVTGYVNESSPVIAASYDAADQLLGAVLVTKNTSSVIRGGAAAKRVMIIWVDQATFTPKCQAETVEL